jgi:hypothetical protein
VVEYARRSLGVVLVLLAVAPIYGALAEAPGIGAQQTVVLAYRYSRFLWTGLPATLLIGVAAAAFLRGSFVRDELGRAKDWLTGLGRTRFLLGLAVLSGGLTLAFALVVLDGRPVMLDAVGQLLQARYFAAGRLAGPPLALPEFWQFQFMLDTPNGWVAQYPFGHAALLALGFKLGAVWAVAPTLVAATVLLTALVAERLFPDDPLTARLGALLLAVSPFFVALAGSYMNHVTAAAFVMLGAYCALRARDGRAVWALAAGAAVGAAFVTRPLAGVVLGAVVTLGVWCAGWIDRSLRGSGVGLRTALSAVGALPFGVGLAAYNAHFFGSPIRFGYLAAWGPRHGLGFHPDPWGNAYGPVQALAYTSADLLGLSTELLWSTVPVVALVGLYFLLGRRLSGGVRLVAAWALLPVLANAFYWHHDLIMGPRMLNEAAPAWALLCAAAAVGLVRRTPHELRVAGWSFRTRPAVTLMLLLGIGAGIFYYGPRRLLSYGRVQAQSGSRLEAPQPGFLSLVFVHDSWRTRLGARLDAGGMRMDSIQAALSYNAPCEVQRFLDAREAGGPGDAGGRPPVLRFESSTAAAPADQAAGGEESAEQAPPPWMVERPPPQCQRQAASDGYGITALPGLLWQGDLPGLPPRGAMFVRDMGPERNERLLARFPDRRALALVQSSPLLASSRPVLVSYERGTLMLWGNEPAGGTGSRAEP